MSAYPSIASEKESSLSQNKIILATGLALFAMFFGAGNIVFPLHIGANTGQNIFASMFGFLLGGVGVPFLGLMASSLYQGDYQAFFARLGKWPAFLIITFLMIIIGPLAAMPRTETTTFNALLPYLPEFLQNNSLFSILYCSLIFILGYRETKVVSILGLFLSPVKIVSFTCLVCLGCWFLEPSVHSVVSAPNAFKQALSHGYNTMDLLATFFYCAVAFKAISLTTQDKPHFNLTQMTLKACIVGALITSFVYLGFMWTAYGHANQLQGLPEENMIAAVSYAVLGKFGGLFVCISVSFACLATALALAEVSSTYLHQEIFKKKIAKLPCLMIVVALTYIMSNLGFQGLMQLSLPLVNIIYPALIVLCIFNILHKWKGITMVKLPFAITLLLATLITFL